MSDKADIWMPLYVGDYLGDTTRLTTAQHGAYLLLIMDYWMSGPPPDDDAVLASITKMSADEWAKTRPVLSSKFEVAGGVWLHGRIDRELKVARKNKEANKLRSRIANDAKAAKRSLEESLKEAYKDTLKVTAECSSEAPPSPSPSPSPTTSHSEGGKRSTRLQAVACPTDVDQQIWADWCQLRKAKRATVTLTVIDGARKEAEKAGMSLNEFLAVWCRRGSQGLEAAWLKPEERGGLSKGAQTMAALTRGLTLPKQRANFWDNKPAEQVVEVVDERKRLL